MATVNVTPGEFGDIVMIYLLDKVLHPDEVSKGNERFDETIDLLKRRGLKAPLTKYYLDAPTEQRFNYKRIKDTLEGGERFDNIRIGPHKKEKVKDKKKEKEGLIKTIGKKILKKLIGQGPESLSQEEHDILNEFIESLDKGDEYL